MTFRLLAGAALAGLVTAQTLAADLTIEVHGIRSDDGRVYLAVHGPESKDTFPSGAGVVKGLREPARAGTLRFVVQGFAPGRVVCGRGRNPTLNVFASNVDRYPAIGILRSG